MKPWVQFTSGSSTFVIQLDRLNLYQCKGSTNFGVCIDNGPAHDVSEETFNKLHALMNPEVV